MPASSAPVKTPPCRFSYVQHMFTKVARKQDDGSPMLDKNGKPILEYQCTLIFDNSADRSGLDAALKEVILAEWGEKGLQMAKDGLIKQPYLKGDSPQARSKKTGEINPGLGADKWFLRVATRLDTVQVRYRSANIPATLGAGEDQIKSGDYGFAVVHAYAWENARSGKGISFGIDYLQKKSSGDSLGSSAGVDADDWHEKVADEGEAPAATQTGAGAAGLFG